MSDNGASGNNETAHKPSAADVSLVDDLWNVSAEERVKILALWEKEGAFSNPAMAEGRLREVIAHAVNDAGEVVAICTATAMTPPRLAQPVYFYRCFIAQDWRHTRLVFRILRHATDLLEEYARGHDYPCIGILLELENDRFKETLQSPHWQSTGFTYIGKSPRGLDVRVHYFRGARLKPAPAPG